jgi:hypothetical protein
LLGETLSGVRPQLGRTEGHNSSCFCTIVLCMAHPFAIGSRNQLTSLGDKGMMEEGV